MSLLALVLVSTSSAYASVYVFDYSSGTATIRSPSVSLQTGTSGSSTISSVATDAATVTATAGITFYESANLATTCTSPTADSTVTAPGTTGSFTLGGATACLWTPQYTVSNSIYAGTSTLNLYAQTNVPAVDASAVTTTKYGLDATPARGTGSAATTVTVTGVTTAYTNELLIAFVSWTDTNGRTVSISGGGLTWSARGFAQANGNYHIEEFYAVAASTISSQTITATFSAATSGGIVLNVFSVAGANTASRFDSNAGLPAHATGASTAPSVSVTTSNAYRSSH